MKRHNTRKQTVKLATAAMLTALGVVTLYLGSVIQVLDLTMVALCSVFIFFAVIEMGSPFPILIYAATSVLSMLLLPDKFAALMYLLFGGIYPVFKQKIERLPLLFSWVIKVIYFNVVLALMVVSSMYLFHIEDTGFTVGFFGLGNVTFILYDVAITKLLSLYFFKLRKQMRIEKYFEKH